MALVGQGHPVPGDPFLFSLLPRTHTPAHTRTHSSSQDQVASILYLSVYLGPSFDRPISFSSSTPGRKGQAVYEKHRETHRIHIAHLVIPVSGSFRVASRFASRRSAIVPFAHTPLRRVTRIRTGDGFSKPDRSVRDSHLYTGFRHTRTLPQATVLSA